jgi:hypothetical protein
MVEGTMTWTSSSNEFGFLRLDDGSRESSVLTGISLAVACER